MTEGSKIKWLIGMVIVLIAVNVVSIGMNWVTAHQGRQGSMRGGRPGDYIVHELSLDASQQAQYREMREAHHREIMAMEDRSRMLHDQLFNLIKSTNDSSAVDSIIGLIGDNRMKQEHLTYRHFAQLRAICRPDQQNKFDEIVREVMDRMHGREDNKHEGQRPGPP